MNLRLWNSRTLGIAALLLAISAGHARAIDIVLDYTHDTYIHTNPTAMAALEAAAADIEAILSTTLPARVDSNSVTVGKASVTMDWSLNYTNPATGADITIDPVDLPADEYRIFVGVRPITQPGPGTKTLGRGGTAAVGLSSGFGIEPLFQSEIPQAIADLGTAVAQIEAEANANATRGGNGPVLGTFNNLTFAGNLGGQSFSFEADISYGVSVGNLWFDADTNDDGAYDSNTQLDSAWHWNHTTPVAGSKSDFYSIAVHELLHSLGFGSGESWDSMINPADPDEWLGANLIALRGTGENAIDIASGAHLASGLVGNVFGTNTPQAAIMGPVSLAGSRYFITDVDAAVLDDINWDINYIEVGLEGDFNDDGTVDAADYVVWRNNLGGASSLLENDTTGEATIGIQQYSLWKSSFGNTSTSTLIDATVPEPSSWIVLVAGAIAGGAIALRR